MAPALADKTSGINAIVYQIYGTAG